MIWGKGSLPPVPLLLIGATLCNAQLYLKLQYSLPEGGFDIQQDTVEKATGGLLTAKFFGIVRNPECELKGLLSPFGAVPMPPAGYSSGTFFSHVLTDEELPGINEMPEVNVTGKFTLPTQCGSFAIAVALICGEQIEQDFVPFSVPCEENVDLAFEYPDVIPEINAVQGSNIESDYVLKVKNNGPSPLAERTLLSAIRFISVMVESGWAGSLETIDQTKTPKEISDEIIGNWMYSFKESGVEAVQSVKYVAGLEMKMVDMTTKAGRVVNAGAAVEIPLKELTVEDKTGYPGLAALLITFDYDETLKDTDISNNAIAFLANFTNKMTFDDMNENQCSIHAVSSDAGQSAAIGGKYTQTFLYDGAEGGFMPISNEKMIDTVMAENNAATTMMRLITTEQCTEETMKSIRGKRVTGFEMVRDNIEKIRSDFELITSITGNATVANDKIIDMMTVVNEVLNAAVDDSNVKAQMFVSQILMFYMKKGLMGAKMMQDRNRRRMGFGPGGMSSGSGGYGSGFGGGNFGPPGGMDFGPPGDMGSGSGGMDFRPPGGMDFGPSDGMDFGNDDMDFGSPGGMDFVTGGMGSGTGDFGFGSGPNGMDQGSKGSSSDLDSVGSLEDLLTGLINRVQSRPSATTSPLTTGTDTVKIAANNKGGNAPPPTKASPSSGWTADGRFFCGDMTELRRPRKYVCDTFPDCKDESDESEESCLGKRKSTAALRDEKISHNIKRDRKRQERDETDDFSMIESYSDAEEIYDQLTDGEKSELRFSAHRRYRKSFEDKILEFIEKYNVTTLDELITAVNNSIELKLNHTRSHHGRGGRGRSRGGRGGRGRGGRFRNRFAFLEDESAETSLEDDSAETSLENDSMEDDSIEDLGNEMLNVTESDRKEIRRVLRNLQRFLEENADGSVIDDNDVSADDIMDVITNIVQVKPRDLEEKARRKSQRKRNRRRTAAMYSSNRPFSMDMDGMKNEIIDEMMERAKINRMGGSRFRMSPPKPKCLMEEERKMGEMIAGIARTLYTTEPENMEEFSFLPLSLRVALKDAVMVLSEEPPHRICMYWFQAISNSTTTVSAVVQAGMMQLYKDIMKDVSEGKMPFNKERLEDVLDFMINNVSVHMLQLYSSDTEAVSYIRLGVSYMEVLKKNSDSVTKLLGTAFMMKMMPDKMIKDISGDPSKEPELWEQCMGLGMIRLAYMEREMEKNDSSIYQKPYDMVKNNQGYKMRKGFRPAYWSEENGDVMQGRYSRWTGLFLKTKVAVCGCQDMYGPPSHPWGGGMDGGMYPSGESYDGDWSGSEEMGGDWDDNWNDFDNSGEITRNGMNGLMFPDMQDFGSGRDGLMEGSGGRGGSMGGSGRTGGQMGGSGGRGGSMGGSGRTGGQMGGSGRNDGQMGGSGGSDGQMGGVGGTGSTDGRRDIMFPGGREDSPSANGGVLTDAQKSEMAETAKKLQTALLDAFSNGGNMNDILNKFPNVNLEALMKPSIMGMLSQQKTHKLPTGDEVTLLNKKERTLLDGSLIISGVVSVFNKGKKSAICNDVWGLREAEVICKNIMHKYPMIRKKKLQFGNAKAQYTKMQTGKPETNDLLPEILLSNVRCDTDAAPSILECSHDNDSGSCSSEGHAGVTCHFMPARRNA